jgi:hypothetical protein
MPARTTILALSVSGPTGRALRVRRVGARGSALPVHRRHAVTTTESRSKIQAVELRTSCRRREARRALLWRSVGLAPTPTPWGKLAQAIVVAE